MNRRALSWALLLAISSRLHGQATPLVPPDGRVYRDLERFAALGLIDTLLLGARPFTEREVVRLLTEAQRNLGRNPAAREWAEPTVASDLRRYRLDRNRTVDEVNAEVAEMGSPPRPAPSDPSGQLLDAVINPLAAYRGGRPLANGFTAGLEPALGATLGPHVAVNATPRASSLAPRGGGSSADLRLQSAYANILFGDFSIEAGRDYALFGQAPTGGLLLSENAPPLDMVRVWNDRAWRIPILSRLFGPIRGMALLADLGASGQIHPHTKLIGYHLTGLPHPNFEIGLEVIDAMGGNGGQPASFGDRVLDAIPIFDAFRTKSDFQFSNKLAGLDIHWRMPSWAGFELYVEADADDIDGRRLKSSLLDDSGYLAGISLSCIVECGRWGVRAEYHQTGIRYYTHGDYPIQQDGFLLGDPLGPRGLGGYLMVDGDMASAGRVSLEGAFEVYSGNTYRAVATEPSDADFHFVQVLHRPAEKRTRALATWITPERGPFSVHVAAGVERVTSFEFIPGNNRTNGLARISLVATP